LAGLGSIPTASLRIRRSSARHGADARAGAEAAQLWIEKGELNGLERSTLKEYRNHANLHIAPLIGREKLSRLTAPMIASFRDELLKKCSSQLARKVLVSLKSIIGAAQERGLVAQNAAQPVKVSVKGREKGKLAVGCDIPSKDEVQGILAGAEGRWRPFFVVAVFTGTRASELRGLTWDNVDFERKVIHIRQRANLWGELGAPKSHAGRREIPMAPMVVNALKEWRLACPKGEQNGNGRVEGHSNISIGAGIRCRSRPDSSAMTASRSTGCTRCGTSSPRGRSSGTFRRSGCKHYSAIARSR
jgi:integrase